MAMRYRLNIFTGTFDLVNDGGGTGSSLQMEEPSSGVVDGSNTVFEFDHLPAFIVSDSNTRILVENLSEINGNGYTVSGAGPYIVTVSDLVPPTSFIANFYNS